jgi:NADPH:quinone reductase-like Zn-dependent oxidoreductase
MEAGRRRCVPVKGISAVSRLDARVRPDAESTGGGRLAHHGARLRRFSYRRAAYPIICFATMENRDAMEILRGLLEAGELAPVVARTFTLAEVPLALAYLQEENSCGRIVVVP